VYKRDGRLVPFEADKISRALFAATEALGRPDAFTARELTDGVVHFLAGEPDNAIPTTAQVADMVVKVVRELGHPNLSQTFDEFARAGNGRKDSPPPAAASPDLTRLLGPPGEAPEAFAWRATAAWGQEFSLRHVVTRDLAAAHAAGLLTLGLAQPFELVAAVHGDLAAGKVVEAIEKARHLVGDVLAIDGPEYALAADPSGQPAAEYARELAVGLRATGLRAVVNLNSGTPPAWAEDLAAGPLFAASPDAAPAERPAVLAAALLERLLPQCAPSGSVRIDLHLAESDLAGDGRCLLRVIRAALEGAAVAFTFDRPRRPVALAEGLDRRHPASLLTIALHLPMLARQLGGRREPATLLQKLESLARLAFSAAGQKRAFLRRHDRGRPAFLLEQARLVVVPVGLDAVVRAFVGQPICAGGPALEFARQVVQRLQQVLEAEGRACNLESCLDSSAAFTCNGAPTVDDHVSLAGIAGLTAWDAAATPRDQLKAAGALHAIAQAGTAAVLSSGEQRPAAEQVRDWLRWAWQHTQVVRVRLVGLAQPQQQLLAAWDEEEPHG
jgi:hypothetical protein